MNKKIPLSVIALIVLFAGLRLFRFDAEPVWIDESFTWLYASQPWGQLWSFVSENDNHPPLFFAFTRLFSFLGDGAFGLRIGAILAGIAALPFIYVAAREFGPAGSAGDSKQNHRTGLIALVLAGVSINAIGTAQNARSYSLMFLAFAIVTASLIWIMRHPDIAKRFFWGAKGRSAAPAFLGLAVGTSLLMWSHNLGLVYAAAAGIGAVVVWIGALAADRRAFLNLFVVAVIIAISWAPQLPVLLEQVKSVSADFWIRTPGLGRVILAGFEVFGDAAHSKDFHPTELILAALLFALAGFAVIQMLRRKAYSQFVIIFTLFGGVILIMLAITYLVRPVLIPRVLSPATAPWFVLVASGISGLGRRWGNTVLLAILLLATWNLSIYYTEENDNEPWPEIIATITGDATQIPTIITVPNSPGVALDYHLTKLGKQANVVSLPGPFPTHSADRTYPTGWPGVPAVTADSLNSADAAIAAADGDIWLLLRGYWIYDPEALVRTHFDKNYCYQPLYLPGNQYFFLLRLIPKSAQETGDCLSYEDDPYYPWVRPETGLITLAD